MSARRLVLGAIGGLLLGAGWLVAFREIPPRYVEGFALLDTGQVRWAFAWAMVVGIVGGAILLATRNDPIIPGVAGVMLLVVCGPTLLLTVVPDWYPDWVATTVLVSVGPAVVFVAAINVGAAGWGAVHLIRASPTRSTRTVP